MKIVIELFTPQNTEYFVVQSRAIGPDKITKLVCQEAVPHQMLKIANNPKSFLFERASRAVYSILEKMYEEHGATPMKIVKEGYQA